MTNTDITNFPSRKWVVPAAAIAVVLLASANIWLGSVHIPAADVWKALCGGPTSIGNAQSFIVWQSRIPMCLTALLSGAALAASGLMLQTVFSNPLADSSVLGISSGAGLGAALVLLSGATVLTGGFNFYGFLAVVTGAFVGAMVVTSVVLFLSTFIRGNAMLLVAGIMIGYLASSVISLLNYLSTAEGVHSYIIWGMGNFGGVSLVWLPWFGGLTLAALFASLLLVKPLNALLLGDYYAENLGFDVRRTRNLLLLITGLLTAVVTAFCGPISFLGLAVPHVARLLLRTSDHKLLLPVTILGGAAVALFCNLVCMLPGRSGLLPLNAVTPLICAPVVVYVIFKQRKG